ncbi:MAG: phosphonate C-P lyase system protein PhnH [Rhodobacteraceae bacterium]|nr:phosphonate C-P lyase system protein PhnH [Paracoccaceae bacterium]
MAAPLPADACGGGFADPSRDAARAFRRVLDALARPGTLVRSGASAPPVPLGPAAGTLVLVLCDATTPVWLAPAFDTPAIRGWIGFHTGAPCTIDPASAAIALGPWEALLPLSRFSAGTAEAPEASATLIAEVPHLTNRGARLTGPGIAGAAFLSLPEELRAARAACGVTHPYPLGLDLFLTCGGDLAGLPRTTLAEAG